MDTKILYDLAIEADINLKHDDGYHDCVAPWTDYLLANPEYLVDVWLDWLAELTMEEMKRLCEGMVGGLKDIENMQGSLGRLGNGTVMQIYGSSAGMNFSRVGALLSFHLKKCAEKYVEENADAWYSDVISYSGDMEAGMKEDYLYEQEKDRRMEEKG